MRKNRFLTFLFSLVPGCGLMYLGYMKKGLQIMAMTAVSIFLGAFFSSLHIGWFGAIFFAAIPIIWFYQMFDAMHTISRMKDQGVGLPEDDGFYLPEKLERFSPAQNRMAAKILAVSLIVIGCVSLVSGVLNNLWLYPVNHQIVQVINTAIRNNLIPGIVSIILIIAGIKLLTGSKSKKNGGGEP